MFQYYSVRLSHPLLPLMGPKPVFYARVSIAALQIGSSVFLSRLHIYVLMYDICFSLSDLLHFVKQALYNRFIHLTTTDFKYIPFYGQYSIIYIYVPASLSIHLLVYRLPPCPSYCK